MGISGSRVGSTVNANQSLSPYGKSAPPSPSVGTSILTHPWPVPIGVHGHRGRVAHGTWHDMGLSQRGHRGRQDSSGHCRRQHSLGLGDPSHLPDVAASPEFGLTAACTTRMESAEEPRQKFGARLALDDCHEMPAHPDIDDVAVGLRAPAHYGPTVAALNAGKHVYTEWQGSGQAVVRGRCQSSTGAFELVAQSASGQL